MWREREWGEEKEALGSWGTSKAEAGVGHSSPPPTRLRKKQNKQWGGRNQNPSHERISGFREGQTALLPAQSGHRKLLSCLRLWLSCLPSEYKNTQRTQLFPAVAFQVWSSQAETSCLCSLTPSACRENKTPVIQQFFFPFTLTKSNKLLSF